MKKKNIAYCIPEGFNPYTTADTIRGLTDSIHFILLEGAGIDVQMLPGDKAGLNALMELLQEQVHALHEYLVDIENRSILQLPMSEDEFDAISVEKNRHYDGVKEAPTIYVVN